MLSLCALALWLGGLLWEAGTQAATPADDGLCGRYGGLPDGNGPHAGMVSVPGGRFQMGDNDHYAEEAVQHEVQVGGFWIDRTDVTNAQFARFVAATGYVTVAERAPAAHEAQRLPPAQRVPGSAVFVRPQQGHAGEWRFMPGANWRHPLGPSSDIEAQANHPVVQIAYEDALAYAHWLGRELPTEAQWEYAARGALLAKPYAWGDRFMPEGKPMANTWQGPFPLVDEGSDGYAGTSPVGCFPANAFGLYDMAGNVWQWTRTVYRPRHIAGVELNPNGPDAVEGVDPRRGATGPARVIKGGSHLCSPNYCMRYRPSARQPAEPGLGTSHIGFRTVMNATQ